MSWYTRRGLLLGVYAASETFALTDRSAGLAETWAFMERRLADAEAMARTAGSGAGLVESVAHGVGSLATSLLDAAGPYVRESPLGFLCRQSAATGSPQQAEEGQQRHADGTSALNMNGSVSEPVADKDSTLK